MAFIRVWLDAFWTIIKLAVVGSIIGFAIGFLLPASIIIIILIALGKPNPWIG